MANDLTNYGESLIADIAFGDATKETSWFVGLLSAITDAEAGTVTELSAGNYARAAFTATTPTNGRIPNSVDTDFGTANADWAPSGTPAVGMALYEAVSGGSPVAIVAFGSSKVIQSGDPVKFAAGALGFTFA